MTHNSSIDYFNDLVRIKRLIIKTKFTVVSRDSQHCAIIGAFDKYSQAYNRIMMQMKLTGDVSSLMLVEKTGKNSFQVQWPEKAIIFPFKDSYKLIDIFEV